MDIVIAHNTCWHIAECLLKTVTADATKCVRKTDLFIEGKTKLFMLLLKLRESNVVLICELLIA